MKNFEIPTRKKTTTNAGVATEPTNRQQQFDRLVEASSRARKLKDRMIADAPNQNTALYYSRLPINYYLLNFVYKTEGITDFKKFNEWKEVGSSVKKGEKAFPIWGQPIGAQKEDEAQSKGEIYVASEEENRHFPICYVFSNLQVRPIQGKGATC